MNLRNLTRIEKDALIWQISAPEYHYVNQYGEPQTWTGDPVKLKDFYGKYDKVEDFDPTENKLLFFTMECVVDTAGNSFYFKKGKTAFKMTFKDDNERNTFFEDYMTNWNHIPLWDYIERLIDQPETSDQIYIFIQKANKYMTTKQWEHDGY